MSIFCLVHGFGQGAWCWDLLIPELQARGHKAVAMDLPIEDPSASLSDFADAVLRSLPKDEDDIILVGHSMAGTVIPIVASKRPVRKLVFLAALIPYPGTSTVEQFYEDVPDMMKAAGCDRPEESKLEKFRDEPDLFVPAWIGKNPSESEAVAIEVLFHDCKLDVARWAISKLRNQKSPAHISDVFPLETLPDVGALYIVCTDDRTISPAWSRYAARKRLGVDAIELPGGHCPYLSRPAHLASVLCG
jgi:pimeloyl-ACP methyl ester carboxylesterase